MNISNLNEYKASVPKGPEPQNTAPSPEVRKAAAPIMGEAAKLTSAEVVEIVQKANKALMSSDSNLKFIVDNESGDNIVQVVDRETQEVLRQIPSVEMLKIAKAIEKMQGVLVSTQA